MSIIPKISDLQNTERKVAHVTCSCDIELL